ncbi:hypothetical protein BDV38DRAFT_295154 [Aspergillus pseudotamarii]|uniref:Isoprenoid synthase domain-containing protein n=1 Tax=Aspergillus pseudotamarii TaxID=132259 RepID=A0A5N6T7Q9_ASPPS|nr:uncharacterized protein BDV38DRAFT_295154 [Aspergillus pseudotamarii]KAE8142373.1 hypothetical protein BDV38DRAFT_295154 [Aspergillus pseudotamarii]
MGATVAVSRSEQMHELLEKLCAKGDRYALHPFNYCFDHIGDKAPYAHPPPLKLNAYLHTKASRARCQTAEVNDAEANILHDIHSIDLFPRQAGMPWHTGYGFVRQNRYWREVQERYHSLLRAFAEDPTAQNTPPGAKFTVADVAMNELKDGKEKTIRYVPLLYPLGNMERTILAGEALALSLVFDEAYEIFGDDYDPSFLQSLMPPHNNKDLTPKTRLQERIWSSLEKMLECDRIVGNGGQETIDTLVTYISRAKPPSRLYETMSDYYDFRYEDGGMGPTYAMIKLSIGSSVDIHSPKLTHFLRLIGDQTLGQNNIASFDKEKSHYLAGMFPQFEQSNGVMVIKRLLSLPTDDAAKALGYTYQLEAERQIDFELERMAASGGLSHEEWKFVDAVLMMSVGNVMGSITMSRYGGAAARLEG